MCSVFDEFVGDRYSVFDVYGLGCMQSDSSKSTPVESIYIVEKGVALFFSLGRIAEQS